MTETQIFELGLWAVGLMFGAISWFLRAKDSQQARELAELSRKHEANEVAIKATQLAVATLSVQSEQIRVLFTRHEDNARGLQRLELALAEGHYKKGELDTKFERLDMTIRSSSHDLITKIEEISARFYENNHCVKDVCK